jgi:hypothetical protein
MYPSSQGDLAKLSLIRTVLAHPVACCSGPVFAEQFGSHIPARGRGPQTEALELSPVNLTPIGRLGSWRHLWESGNARIGLIPPMRTAGVNTHARSDLRRIIQGASAQQGHSRHRSRTREECGAAFGAEGPLVRLLACGELGERAGGARDLNRGVRHRHDGQMPAAGLLLAVGAIAMAAEHWLRACFIPNGSTKTGSSKRHIGSPRGFHRR